MTTNHEEMTHLVMTRPERSIKFIYALCRAKYILKSSWLEESAKLGYFQPEEPHWLTSLGTSYKCDIPAVVKSVNKHKLFENRVFYITPTVTPAPGYLRWLIEKCGGKLESNRRSVMKIHELNNQNPNSYIIISCPEDLHLIGFKHFVCYVCTTEFILQSIMSMSIDFISHNIMYAQ